MARSAAPRRPLSREHRTVWFKAFRIAFKTALRRDGDTLGRTLPAITRLSEEAAWAALDAYVRAVKGIRP
jgi:hypothetical protein